MERLTRRKEDVPGRWEYDCSTREIIDKLAEYEDLEEQGKLLKLPVVVGDIVYVIELDEKNFTVFRAPLRIAEYEFSIEMIGMLKLFGKCIFTTKEAAEAALKEMENKHE